MAALAAVSAVLVATLPGPSGGLLGGPAGQQEGRAAVPSGAEAGGETAAVTAAVKGFSASYNYSGSDGDELLAQVRPHVTNGFWSSPRGSQNARDFAAIDSYVLQQSWLLAWEPVEVGATQARGYATRGFHVERAGGTQDYKIRHELRLVKESGAWKVAWGGDPLE